MSTEIFNGPLTGEVDPRLLQGFAAIIALVEKLGQETKKTDEVQKEAKSTWDSFVDSLRETRDEAKGAGEAYTYIVGSLRDVVATVDATVTQMANLSREHERLSQGSEQLHLDFQQASSASGVFVSQLTALNAAGTFASYGLRLTQDQMDAVIKRAGIYSRQSGVEMTQSVQQLTEALAKGEQEGLARFGGGLVSLRQGAGTAADRLALLVTETRGMTGAAATAADEFDRWKESISSLERVAVGEFSRGYIAAMHEAERATGSTAHSVEQLGATGREKFEALGHGVAAVKDGVWLLVDATRAAVDGILLLTTTFGSLDDLRARFRDVANDARAIAADVGYGNGPQIEGVDGSPPVAEGRSLTEMLGSIRDGFAQDRADLSALVSAGEQAQDIQTRKRNIAARMAHGGGAHQTSRAQLARMAEKAALNAVAGQEDVLRRQAGELSAEYGGAPDANVSLVNRVTAAGDRAAGLMDQSLAGESIDPALQGALDSLTGVDDRLQAALGRVRGRQQRGTPEEERRRDEERRGAVDPAIEGQRERERQRREADARMEDEQKADQLRQRRETLAGRLGAYSQQEPAEARAARDIRTAWEGATEALGSHIGMLASGQETWGSFWDGIGASAKKVLSEVTLAEGKAEFARALVSAAALNPAGVALHTAAGLALVGVSAALGGGGGASAPAAGGGGSSRAADVKPRDSATSSAQGQNVTINFGAPVIAAGDNPGAAGRYLTRLMREALVREGVRLPNG